MATSILTSLEEYLSLPAREDIAGYEYDDGRVIEVPHQNVDNATIQANLISSIWNVVRAAGLDFRVTGPTGFWLTPAVERIPDICVVNRARLAAMEVYHGSRRGAPDMAIEIVSPHDTAWEVDRKLSQYLAAGVAVVILLYPENHHVQVCRSDGDTRLGPGDTLEIPELLPGLKLAVDDLFKF